MKNFVSSLQVVPIGVVILSVLLISLIILVIIRFVEKWREEKREQKRLDREELLKILPQLSINAVRALLIDNLKWIQKSAGLWLVILPKPDTISLSMLGRVLGNIMNKWKEITEQETRFPSSTLAYDILSNYAKEEIEGILLGMRSHYENESKELQREITLQNSQFVSDQNKERLDLIIKRGLRAFDIKKLS